MSEEANHTESDSGRLLKEGRDICNGVLVQLQRTIRQLDSLCRQHDNLTPPQIAGSSGIIVEGRRRDAMLDGLQTHKQQLECLQKEHEAGLQAALERHFGPQGFNDNGDAQLQDHVLQMQSEHEERVRVLHRDHIEQLSELVLRTPRFRSKEPSGVDPEASWTTKGSKRSTPAQSEEPRDQRSTRSTPRQQRRQQWTSHTMMLHNLLNMTRDFEPVDTRSSRSWRRVATLFSAEILSGILITLNMVWMSVEVDYMMRRLGTPDYGAPDWVWWGDMTFTILFTLEIVGHVCLYGKRFCDSAHIAWNTCNVVIVAVDLADIFVRVYSPGFLRSIRVLRSIRFLRVVRAIRYVRELRLMVASIACSMASLSWALVLLLLVTLMASMCLMQTLQEALEKESIDTFHPQLLHFYGSLGSSMLSFCMAITGGTDWTELTAPLESVSRWYTVAFVLFLSFLIVGLLNILTAVFVESTHRIAEVDSDLVIQEQVNRDISHFNKLRQFFAEADLDRDGQISVEEFERKLKDPHCQARLQTLDMDVWAVRGMFRMLNANRQGIDVEALVYGLVRLKGSAKAVDMAMLLYETKKVSADLRRLLLSLHGRSSRTSSCDGACFEMSDTDYGGPGGPVSAGVYSL